MSWERDPLWAKARLFFEHALSHDRDDARFGLWCAFGLELLARAAVSSISPTLLAESDREHRNLLHVLGRGNPKVGPQSIGSTQVFRLCETLFPTFTSEHGTSAIALVNRRNVELHTGQNAFDEYTTQHWVSGFYACCKVLAEAMGESLKTLLGEGEAAEADTVLAVAANEVRQRVCDRIARYKAVFADRPEAERTAALESAEAEADRLAHARHHRVKCPACSATATLQGDSLGSAKIEHEDAEIVVKQAIAPRKFGCATCGLKLDGYAELATASLGDQYTRTTRYSPEEYYELISPDDLTEVERIAIETLGMYHAEDRDYDNE
jgi:hypothetical protein